MRSLNIYIDTTLVGVLLEDDYLSVDLTTMQSG